MNETRVVAKLPSLDVEITHRREADPEVETLQLTMRAAPGFNALGARGPLALWTAMAMAPLAMWQAWLTPPRAARLPERSVRPRRDAKVIPIGNGERER